MSKPVTLDLRRMLPRRRPGVAGERRLPTSLPPPPPLAIEDRRGDAIPKLLRREARDAVSEEGGVIESDTFDDVAPFEAVVC